MNKFTLAYCADNALIAKEIDERLSNTGFEFKHISCNPELKDQYLGEQIPADEMIILLVSDNLLKSRACMYNALLMIQRLSSEARIISVIVDGVYRNADGSTKTVPTSFDRVSHVIQYMNFWQDEYLELRKKKKSIPEDQAEAFEKQLTVVRNISSEVGEFLRILRSVESYSFENFAANNYKIFYYKTGNQIKHVEQAVPEEILHQVVQETPVSETTNELEVVEEPPATVLENIPGMDQLAAVETPVVTTETTKEEVLNQEETLSTEEIDAAHSVVEEKSEKPNSQLLDKLVAYREQQQTSSEDQDAVEDKNSFESQLNQVVDEVVAEETNQALPEQEEELSTEEILQSIFDEEEEEELAERNDQQLNISSMDELTQEVEGHTPTEDLIAPEEHEATPTSTAEPNLTRHKSLSGLEEKIYEASSFAEAGNTQKAISILADLVAENPANTLVRYQYVYLLDAHGDQQDKVLTELQTILSYDPDHVKANWKLASLAEENKDFLAARNYYEKVVKVTNEYPEIYFKLGVITAKHFVGQKEKAARFFKKSLKLDKTNADAHYRYAVLLNEALDNPEKAVKHFKKCLALQHDHNFAYYDLALLYYKVGKYKKAEHHYLLACKNNPEFKTEANDLAFANPPNDEKLTKQALNESLGKEVEINLTEEHINTDALVTMPAPAQVVETTTEEEDSEESVSVEMEEEVATEIDSPVIIEDEETIEEEEIEEEVEMIELSNEAVEVTPPVKKLDQVVFITGASSGIGKATSELFAKQGYNLILTGRRKDRLALLKDQLEAAHGIQVNILVFDVRDNAAVEKHLADLPEAWKQIDILINNAGLAKGLAPIHEGKLDHWETMIDTNIKGLLYMTRAIAPFMVQRRQGQIINIGSTSGKEVYPNGNVYCATKFAVDSLTKSMRLDLHKYNIRVSQVSPGHVEETEFALVRFDGDQERSKIYEDFQPLKSSDVAEVIYFMATRPAHVNIQDVLLMGTQQAGNNHIHRSGRKEEEEE
ncbi:MAG: SDR family NAD(P)-dependent oxidoreductase [Saprospiraceae bacterium]